MKASVFLGLLVSSRTLRRPKILEQLDADAVVARVGLVAEREIRLDRVEPLILQRVRLDLLHQADPAAFLRQIDEHARPFVADHVERHVQLIAAVAAERLRAGRR